MKPALHFPRFGKTLLAAALVAMAGTGCAADQSLLGKLGGIFGSPAATKSAAVAVGKPIEGDITSLKALEFLYGKVLVFGSGEKRLFGNDCVEWAPWTPPTDTAKFKEYFDGKEKFIGKTMAVCKAFSANYTEQGKQKFVLVTKAGTQESFDAVNFSTSDAPIPMIGVAVFANDGGKWSLEVEDKYVSLTSFSEAIKLQKIGSEKYGVLFETLWHYGTDCNGKSAELFVPYGGGIKKFALETELTEKEQEMVEECGGDTSVRFETASPAEYYDITVKQTFKTGRKSLKKTQRLHFQDGDYVKAATKKRK